MFSGVVPGVCRPWQEQPRPSRGQVGEGALDQGGVGPGGVRQGGGQHGQGWRDSGVAGMEGRAVDSALACPQLVNPGKGNEQTAITMML